MYGNHLTLELLEQLPSSIPTKDIDLIRDAHNDLLNYSQYRGTTGTLEDSSENIQLTNFEKDDDKQSPTSKSYIEAPTTKLTNMSFEEVCKSKKTKCKGAVPCPPEEVEDMKQYYENEIAVLKKLLHQNGHESTTSENSLIKRCYSLEQQLQRIRNEKEFLSEQVEGLRTQLRIWPGRIDQLEEENHSLRVKVDDYRAINHKRQNEVDRLHEIIKTLQAKLWDHSTKYNRHGNTFNDQLLNEYNNLSIDYDRLKIANMKFGRKMCEEKLLIDDMSTELEIYKMKYFQLEEENRFLKKSMLEHKFKTSNYLRRESDSRCAIVSNDEQESMKGSIYCKVSTTNLPHYDDSPMFRNPRSDACDSLAVKEVRFKNLKENQKQELYAREELKNDDRYLFNNSKIIKRKECGSDGQVHSGEIISKSPSKPCMNFPDRFQDHDYGMNETFDNFILKIDGNSERGNDEKERFFKLQEEKKELIINLSHIPVTSMARNKRINRERRESLEARLDHIDRQLGLLRMTFKPAVWTK